MRKKIYDIKPPKVKKLESELKAVSVAKKSTAKKQKPVVYQEPSGVSDNLVLEKRKRNFTWLYITGFTGAACLGILSYLFFVLPKADIDIWPKLEVMSFQETVKADSKISSDTAGIPAYYFENQQSISQTFPATGNASDEGRAEGQITIFNKHQPFTSITLREGTRFISDSGMLFLLGGKVVVPQATKSGNKIVPGSVTVKVKAAEGGNSYNIGPSTFSIPGFKGTAYYFDVYATSDKAMQGGFSGDVKKVTDNDVQTAKDMLSKKVIGLSEDTLKKQYGADYIIVDDSFDSNVTFDDSQVKVGGVKQDFSLTSLVKTGVLAVKKSDVNAFIQDNVFPKIPEDMSILESSLKEDYSLSDVDFNAKKMTLNMDISIQVYRNIDENHISLSLLGQNTEQINQSVNNMLGDSVSKVETHFWPFWVKKSPNSQKAVHIQIKFE